MPSLQWKKNVAYAVTHIGNRKYRWHKLGIYGRVCDAKVAFENWQRENCPTEANKPMNIDELSEIYWKHVQKSPHTLSRERDLKKLVVNQFGNLPIHKLTPDMIVNWRNDMAKKYKPNTIRLRLGFLKSILTFAVRQGYIMSSPAMNVQRPLIRRSPPKFLPKELILHILDTAKGRHKFILSMLYYTGMRPIELHRLTVKDVDLQAQTLSIIQPDEIIHGNKNRGVKTIPIHPVLLPLLSEHLPAEGQICSTQNVKRIINIVKKRLGIKDHITPYMFRHSFATHILEESPDDKTLIALKELLGHTTLDMTLRYARPLDERLKSTINLLK